MTRFYILKSRECLKFIFKIVPCLDDYDIPKTRQTMSLREKRLEKQAKWAEWRDKNRDLIGDAQQNFIISFVCRDCHKVIRNQRDNETGYDCLPCQFKRQRENRRRAFVELGFSLSI